jgi:hypothetical protein
MTMPASPRTTAGPAAGTGLFARFWKGFAEASLAGLGAVALGFFAMLVVALWFFSEATLSGAAGRFLPRSSLDSEGFATQRALALERLPPERPRLLVLGSSATANALAGELPLAEELKALTGIDWDVHMLTTALQSPLEQLALVERALGKPSRQPQPVVIAVGSGLLRQSWTAASMLRHEQAPRLGLRSAWADAEVVRLGGTPRPRRGFYPVDNYRFVAANGSEALMRLLLRQPAHRRIDAFAPAKPLPPEKRARQHVGNRIRVGLKDNSAFLAVLRSLHEHVRQRPEVRIVQIEEPVSPGLLKQEQLESALVSTTAALTAFGTAEDMPYLPIIADAAVPDSAYHDDLHIAGREAQAAIRKAFAARLAGLIKQGWIAP